MTLVTLLQIFGGAIIGAIIAGIFTLLGVWISQRGAVAVAKSTLEGQRVLARDAALRDWRKQLIDPYIEAANQRVHLWTEMHDARDDRDSTRWLSLLEQRLEPHFNSLLDTSQAIPDDAFKAAFQNFVEAEGPKKGHYTKEEIMDVIMKMRVALVDLNKATEHFLFSSEIDPLIRS